MGWDKFQARPCTLYHSSCHYKNYSCGCIIILLGQWLKKGVFSACMNREGSDETSQLRNSPGSSYRSARDLVQWMTARATQNSKFKIDIRSLLRGAAQMYHYQSVCMFKISRKWKTISDLFSYKSGNFTWGPPKEFCKQYSGYMPLEDKILYRESKH